MQGRTTVEEVLCLSAEWGYTVFYRNCEDNNVLSDIVVAHPTSIAMIEMWPYILIIDTTYKMNKKSRALSGLLLRDLEILLITDMKLPLYRVYEDKQKEHVHRDHIMRVGVEIVDVKIHIYLMVLECVGGMMRGEDET
ncbi:hypothetical protein M9H77_11942 [Catharanthus roseus]|uniref:Uncharacterized protein n=1 Tax=Catharanthus roseus TaxID=4058 RepID=A0ACC0BG55_CATRO|nr:hypothetical protein M9H77_11942 [Catharanthus roseus]